MTALQSQLGEEFSRLALAIDQHLPGYVDSFFGPEEWQAQAKEVGQLPLQTLTKRADTLAKNISQADGMDAQRRDFLARQVNAMHMSLRLLAGEKVSLAEEVHQLYDVQPAWKDETAFDEAHRALNEALPAGDSLRERMQAWDRSLEIPVEQVRTLLPFMVERLRKLTRARFDLPESENFDLEFVSNQPWGAYNWFLGKSRSRIDINTDLPLKVTRLADLIAHEGYPGHHTELSIKEARLIGGMNWMEFSLTLINSPSCVVSEGIATSALATVLTEAELAAWYREEILPRAGMPQLDTQRIMEVSRAREKFSGAAGNAAFMLHDQGKSEEEISLYLQKYRLSTEKEAWQTIKFISNPLYRSYIFTYHIGYDLLKELFSHGQREHYFKRLLEEPVTPEQIRIWIRDLQN